ncbi:MAG: hypothetical protein IJS46_06390 [Kiritimatiellae bacterium]|nr:hypothetical protein [Kiritimatiellia bacterium]
MTEVIGLIAAFAACAVPAFGATVQLPDAPASEFADTESVTNATLGAAALADARLFTGSVTLDATVSNAVEVAFGVASADGGGLRPGEETFAVGWDGGRWFIASATNRVESAEIVDPARRTLSLSMRISAFGSPHDLAVSAEGDGAAFGALCASAPEWLFSRGWNAARLTVRGIDPTGESVSVRFATDPGTFIIR